MEFYAINSKEFINHTFEPQLNPYNSHKQVSLHIQKSGEAYPFGIDCFSKL